MGLDVMNIELNNTLTYNCLRLKKVKLFLGLL